MWAVRFVLGVVLALGVSGCAETKFKTYDGPEVTRIQVQKADRRLFLFHNDKILKSYRISLGFQPLGHKVLEGDGRTPEGAYLIDRRNPNSNFHLSLGISYPNVRDVEVARSVGGSPGGEIFIHGASDAKDRYGRDWTAGCIAVLDEEMEEIYAMVKDGTLIQILP